VAIDSEIRNDNGTMVTVDQPLPLPDGVSNYAVGGVMAHSYSSGGRKGIFKGFKRISNSSPGLIESTDTDTYVDPDYEEEAIFTDVDNMPVFVGRGLSLDEFIAQNLLYPFIAVQNGVEGMVELQFIINPDGSVSDVEVITSLGSGCDEEAIRLINLTDSMWLTGKDNGSKVRVKMSIGIQFIIE